jgi:diketogulonate reductase-like aldo/keto reductase
VTLNSGYTMPVLGLGTWTLSNEEAENSVYHALKSGMRLIDTARYYRCEKGVGNGIRKAVGEGFVSREEIFVTSKIMPSDYDRAAQGIDDSLKDLGLDYVDLMLIHQPGSDDEAVYRAMEQAVRDGKVRSIGISNYYTKEQVDEVLSFAEIMPAVIQNENHLYYQNDELRDYVTQYGIVIESWYPFGGRGHTQDHFTNETIVRIAKAHDKTPAQVILRWQVQDGYITIPGSSNPDHIAENADIFMHAKKMPGSHVIIVDPEPSDQDIAWAARLAAAYSKGGSSSRVPVDYTLRRYVKKPGGAKPGFVIYTHQHTLSVEPLRIDPQNQTAGGE